MGARIKRKWKLCEPCSKPIRKWNCWISSFLSVLKYLCNSISMHNSSVVGSQPGNEDPKVQLTSFKSNTARCQCWPVSAGMRCRAGPMFRPEGVPSSPIVVATSTESWGMTFFWISRIFFPPSQPWITIVYAFVITLVGALAQFLL